MDRIKFSDVFEFQKKSTIKAGDGLSEGIYSFYTSSTNLSKYINAFQHNRPSLIFGTGGNANIHLAENSFSTSTDCLVAQLKNNIEHSMNIKFVYYYLFGNMWILKKGFKGAGLKHISKEYISQITIPKFTLYDQDQIVKILDQADALRQKRKQAISLLDEYLKSTFLEMFGDPINNPKRWEIISLEKITKKITDGTHQSPNFIESGIPFIFISNIVNNEINLNTKKYITKDRYRELTKSTPIEVGDILYTTVGSYGNPAIVKTTEKFCFQRHIAHIKPDHNKTNRFFLFGMLNSPFIKRQVDEKVRGIAQKTLNLADLKELKVFLPPIDIQNKYANVVQQTELIKKKMINQAEELERQFRALMQKYFREKPANIMIDQRGVPIILDFGLAKLIDYSSITQTDRYPVK